MGEWPTYPLSSFVVPSRSICYGIVQPGAKQQDGVPIVRVNNFRDGGIDTNEVLRVAPAIEHKYSRSRLVGGELLVTLVGTIGLSAIAPCELRGWNVARAVGVVPLRDDVDKRWVNFVVRSAPSQDFINTHANTTVQATFNLKDLARLPVPMPPEEIRTAISEILSALDDKIELNRQTNETLEALARAIFKDWFVDFGPTRAKAEGRAPYLAPELWDLFPDALDEDDKPVGWEMDSLGSFTKIKNGYAFKSKDWRDEGVPVVKIGSVKPAFVDLKQVSYIDECLAEDRSDFRLNTGDMLVGLTGYVGETGRIPPTDIPPMLNQRVGKFEPVSTLDPYIFACVRNSSFKNFAESKGHGSAQANVSTKDLLSFPVINPSPPLLEGFCRITGPLFEKSLANEGESGTLGETRDLLLPKLMSGKMKLSSL